MDTVRKLQGYVLNLKSIITNIRLDTFSNISTFTQQYDGR